MNLTNLTTGKKSAAFPGKIIEEDILIFVRRHWIAFVNWLVFLAIMLLIPPTVFGILVFVGQTSFLLGEKLVYLTLLSSTILLFSAAVFMVAWIEYYLDVSIITTDRLVTIRQIGLFNRRVAELSLLRIQDVSAQMNGYLQSFFQFGTVIVETAGETPNFVMYNVPKPHLVANTILMVHDRLAHSQLGEKHIRREMAIANQDTSVPEREIQKSIIKKLPTSAPPKDFDRRRLDSGISRINDTVQQELEPVIQKTPPNRLPPDNRFKDSQQLEEGELISLQDS
ncbi:PH domain-containing protein [Candidatus Berkelbacteria bacterium]|nr:PH domain-containing protein [Candidatus Berkelbacteria bacterium]